jgi:predicted transcriptional regulator
LVPKNSYIYNKYFKEHTHTQQVQRPLTPLEYRNMLINDILERQKIKQMKSTKLIMPTANINVAPHSSSMNKLFHFSQR